MVESDPHRFETLAQGIAGIPVDGRQAVPGTAADVGLRPALRIEVLDPHDLWDARDARVQRGIEPAAPVIAGAAAPRVARAVLDRVETRLADVAVRRNVLRPALSGENAGRSIQLGAYSSETAARAAWRDFTTGDTEGALSDLQPEFEKADVNGRSVVRLKVSAPSHRVGAVCRTTGIDTPWCLAAA